jgi:hypothetical protein
LSDGRGQHELSLGGGTDSFIRLQLAGDLRVRMKRTARIPELDCVELLQPRHVCAPHAGCELGRLLVALDQSALDFLLLGQAGEGGE